MNKLNISSFETLFHDDERLKIFNDTVPTGILVISFEDGKVVFSNQFVRDTHGCDGDQVLGASWEEFYRP